jgi:hypothetical protein
MPRILRPGLFFTHVRVVNARVVFEEIPPRRAPRSQQFYISNFAFFFAFSPVLLAITRPLWPHPLSLQDKFVLGGFAFISLLSGVFLLNARSVPQGIIKSAFGI